MTSLPILRGRRIGGDAPASFSDGYSGGYGAVEANSNRAQYPDARAGGRGSSVPPNPRGLLPPAQIIGRFGRICATSAAATPPNVNHPSPASLSRARTGRGGFVNIARLLRRPQGAAGVVGNDRQSGVKERQFVVPKMFAFGE